MNTLVSLVEQDPLLAQVAFENMQAALNEVLPGTAFHVRYEDAEEIGLAVVVGKTDHTSYNPLDPNRERPTFTADNQATHRGAWDAMTIAPEFLDGQATELGRFAFFALAKTENLRLSRGLSSYDPERLAIAPGRVGFAGSRRLMGSFVGISGLWEVHDHLVSGTYAVELTDASTGSREPRTVDALAEYFEQEFTKIQALHEGVPAAEISHADVGKLLPLVDTLPYLAA